MYANKKKGLTAFAVVSLLGMALAQTGSYLVATNLEMFRPVRVTGFLYLHHVRNEGGVFGVGQGLGWGFTIVSILFLGGLCYFMWKDTKLKFYEYPCAGLVMAGGLSNVCDRFVYGSVIDFIDIKGIPFWHYIFNSADVLIHLGIWPWLILGFWYNKQGSSKEKAVAPE